jgi:hypothetical protein
MASSGAWGHVGTAFFVISPLPPRAPAVVRTRDFNRMTAGMLPNPNWGFGSNHTDRRSFGLYHRYMDSEARVTFGINNEAGGT